MKSFLMFCSASVCALAVTAAPVSAQQSATPAKASKEAKPFPSPSSSRRSTFPIREFTLPNGLRVIVHTDRKAAIVAVSTWYDVGSKHEPTGKSGFAHLFEHLMFNGSENSPGDFFEPLKQVGRDRLQRTTSFDRTNYFETVPRAALDRALFLESDRMGWLLGAIDQAVLDEQRGVVQNEKRQNDNRPYGLVYTSCSRSCSPRATPMRTRRSARWRISTRRASTTSRTGSAAITARTTRCWCLPATSTPRKRARSSRNYFGAIARGPGKRGAQGRGADARRGEERDDQGSRRGDPALRSWTVPGLNDPDAVPLDVFASVLGGLSSSRLETRWCARRNWRSRSARTSSRWRRSASSRSRRW